nr:putative retrotransposon Ty1-copia subclass protein [Tanacetum cinerariifolium]
MTQRVDPVNSVNLQQPMTNPKDITDPTTAMNMALALMAKAFKLNYSTPTNNNQRISSNPRNRQIAKLGMNMGQDKQIQMIGGNGGNQFRQYAWKNIGNPAGYNDAIGNQVIQNAVQNLRVQNVGNQNGLIGVQGNGNQNQIGNEEYDLMAAAVDLDESKEVNANCILMANLQQASTSGTQTDSAPVYDTDGSAENDNEIISEDTGVEQGGETVEQHPANFEETHALYESLYQNLEIEVEKVNSVNRKLKETNADLTTELARFKNQERCFEISQDKYDKLESLDRRNDPGRLIPGFNSILQINDEVGDLGEPANYKAAMLDPDKVIWKGAMDEEMNSMKVMKVWIVVDLPPNANVVRSKCLYKKKTSMDGKVHTYKARLVAKGCTQTYEIDYVETFSPVAYIRVIRILIAIAAYYDYEIWQMDVKTTFLNGRLDEDIYMEQPEGNIVTNLRVTPSWREIVSLTGLVKLASYT